MCLDAWALVGDPDDVNDASRWPLKPGDAPPAFEVVSHVVGNLRGQLDAAPALGVYEEIEQ
jgi:hypothetical protein